MKYGQKLTLKQHRILAGYSQETFAEALDVDRSTVAFWETGRSNPRAKSIAKIETVLGIKWADDILMPEA